MFDACFCALVMLLALVLALGCWWLMLGRLWCSGAGVASGGTQRGWGTSPRKVQLLNPEQFTLAFLLLRVPHRCVKALFGQQLWV
jgi:hypothetical protein